MEGKKIKGTGAEIINFLSMLKVVDFIGLFNVEWHSQNEFGNIGILLLLRDRKKTLLTFPYLKKLLHKYKFTMHKPLTRILY